MTGQRLHRAMRSVSYGLINKCLMSKHGVKRPLPCIVQSDSDVAHTTIMGLGYSWRNKSKYGLGYRSWLLFYNRNPY